MCTFWAIKSAVGVVSHSVSQSVSQSITHVNALWISASLLVSHLWRLQQGQPPSFSTHTRTHEFYVLTNKICIQYLCSDRLHSRRRSARVQVQWALALVCGISFRERKKHVEILYTMPRYLGNLINNSGGNSVISNLVLFEFVG